MLLEQMRIISEVNHKNIVKVFEMFESKKSIYIVSELIKDGSLTKAIKDVKLAPHEIRSIMKSLLGCLSYLHSKNIMHRNIKLDNILLHPTPTGMEMKLTGFSLACKSDNHSKHVQKCGTPGYISPEIFGGKPYTPLCDIFSSGAVFFILLTHFLLLSTRLI